MTTHGEASEHAGRVVLITGAGAGIGRGVARRFARTGARLVVAEVDPEAGRRVVLELEGLGAEAHFVETDVGERVQVERAVEETLSRFGSLHVLVNNAWSGAALARVEWIDEEAVRRAFEVGTLGCLHAMQACFAPMRAQGFGRIVSMCSLNGVNAHRFTVHYNMAKEALRALTRTAAREWADRGITANVVCPAAETEATRALRRARPELFAAVDATLPMGRLGDPEDDIAPVVLFLASEGARYLTGNTLFVDGGSHIEGAAWSPELPEERPATSGRVPSRG